MGGILLSAFFIEVIYFPELQLTVLSHIKWLCLSLPINQTGFPHSQVTHYNDFRDFKSAERNKREEVNNNCQNKTPPLLRLWSLCSPHGAGALLLTGGLHFIVKILLCVQSRLFPEILKERRKDVWGYKLFMGRQLGYLPITVTWGSWAMIRSLRTGGRTLMAETRTDMKLQCECSAEGHAVREKRTNNLTFYLSVSY